MTEPFHELPGGNQVKLGRAEPSPPNPKDLELPRFLRAPAQLPRPPEVIDNTTVVHQPWPMLANNKYGCCVFSSSGHRIITQAAMLGRQVQVTDRQALRGYSEVTGFDPRTGQNDNGAIMVDAANWERRHELAGDTIFAFARIRIDPRDREMLDLATFYLGGVWFGVGLPQSAQRQTGQVWDVTSGPNSEPWSWGGHAIWSPKSNPDERECVTWAKMQRMTHAFVATYADEAWGILPRSWHRRDPFEAIEWSSLDAAVAQFGPVNPGG